LFIQFHDECISCADVNFLFIYLFTSTQLHGNIRLVKMQNAMYTIKSVYI